MEDVQGHVHSMRSRNETTRMGSESLPSFHKCIIILKKTVPSMLHNNATWQPASAHIAMHLFVKLLSPLLQLLLARRLGEVLSVSRSLQCISNMSSR